MDRVNCKIKSSETVDLILERLKKVTIEKQPFLKPKGILFLGRIQGDSFRLITFNSPPMNFNFKVQNNQIEFAYKKASLTKSFKWLILGITIPVFLGLWVWGLVDKEVDIVGKIILTTMLLLPFVINKLTKHLYEKFILVNEEKLIIKIENELKIKIEKHTTPNNG